MVCLKLALELFHQWNKQNVVYCHWKSNEHLKEGLNGTTDLDVLVRKEDKSLAEFILKELGYLKCVSQYGSQYYDVDDWIGCDKEFGKLIHIHLHYRMATGHKGLKEYSLPWVDYALNERVLENNFGIYVCPVELELVILYTRIGLKATYKKLLKAHLGIYNIDPNELKEILYLKSRADLSVVKSIINKYFSAPEDMFRLISNDKLCEKGFLELVKIVTHDMESVSMLKPYNRFVSRIGYSLSIPYRKGMKKTFGINYITRKTMGEGNGLSIVFIGQDGAGKSTVSTEVLKWLTWKLDTRMFYLGSGDHHNSIRKKLANKLCGNNILVKLIRSILFVDDLRMIARKNCKKIKKSYSYVNYGGIAVFDRYPQLQFPGINDGPKIATRYIGKVKLPYIDKIISYIAKKEEKYLQDALCYSPDLVFKLTLPPEVSIMRKPQENIEDVKKKHQIVKDLKFDSSNIINIDANMDYEEELILIHNCIWEAIVEKVTNSNSEYL
ncbi:hypothetical protein PNU17_07200 [Turicibacter sanguinis]|uniref:hypothetical protein n=1 Tax=Turicibacter sanguinis TaxID=154288 RepID=UPI001898BB7E|nr:hypothetical protein [Turicibacter sanguinis]MDB8555548.1 hypothetical protein [Turicibacter sanguinis]